MEDRFRHYLTNIMGEIGQLKGEQLSEFAAFPKRCIDRSRSAESTRQCHSVPTQAISMTRKLGRRKQAFVSCIDHPADWMTRHYLA